MPPCMPYKTVAMPENHKGNTQPKAAGPKANDRNRNGLLDKLFQRYDDRLEYDFMPATVEVLDKPPAPFTRWILWLIVCFATFAIVYACLARMDVVASATGTVMPTQKVKVIQPLEEGVVKAIYVRDGQVVKKDEVLVEIDNTDTKADQQSLTNELHAATLEVGRLNAQIKNDCGSFCPPEKTSKEDVELHRNLLDSAIREHQQQIATIDSEISKFQAEMEGAASARESLKKTIPLIQEIYNKKINLERKGSISRKEIIEAELELLTAQQSLETEKSRYKSAQAELARAKERKRFVEAEYRRNLFAKLSEAEKARRNLAQQLIKAGNRENHKLLRAPINGIVQQLAVNTVGGVVTTAQPLMVIVPIEGDMEVEATIRNQDIGFVRIGQDVSVKINAYPFTRHGAIKGKLEWVGKDAIRDQKAGPIYPARVSVATYELPNLVEGKRGKMMPGMAVTADIVIGKRRMIEYFITPILRYMDESLKEK